MPDDLARGVTVYLLHIEPPSAGGNHYLGAAYDDTFPARLNAHARAAGASFTRNAVTTGRSLTLVRAWRSRSWEYEKELKASGNFRRHCPICSPGLQNRYPPPYPRIEHASPKPQGRGFKSFGE